MLKKSRKPHTPKPSSVPKMPKVHQIKVNKTEVVEVKVPVGTQPVVVQKAPDTVAIIPVPRAKKKSWLKSIFGY